MLSGDTMSAFYMTLVYGQCILDYTKPMPLFSACDIEFIFSLNLLFSELLDKTSKVVKFIRKMKTLLNS